MVSPWHACCFTSLFTRAGECPAAGLAGRPLASPVLLLWSVFRVCKVAAGGPKGLLKLPSESWVVQQKNTLHESVTAAV